MESKYPCFSVIIPQKNRAEYLEYTLRSCMIQDYPNFEIIVSDDNSDDNSIEVIKNLMKIDSRIKLFAHEKHLGMRDNFEFALNQVKPGYVIVLGGDDGLIAGCIWKMYEIIRSTKTELLTWKMAQFSYPFGNDTRTFITVPRVKKTIIKKIKSEDFLNKLANTFMYLIDECPMIYLKGVVSTNLIDRVKSRGNDNCFYHCPTPDGFSGVVLAGEVEDYIYTNEPLSIGGTSYKSQGLNYARTDKKSREEAQQFFNDNVRLTMHKELASQPYSPLVTLMTADYLLTAQDLPGWPGKFKTIDFERLIRVVFNQVQNTHYDNSVLIRELKILREIAKQHNLEDLFNKLLLSSKHKVPNSKIVWGLAFTHSIRFEGTEFGINNIYDASMSVNTIYNWYQKISFLTPFKILWNSIKIVYNSRKHRTIDLPNIN